MPLIRINFIWHYSAFLKSKNFFAIFQDFFLKIPSICFNAQTQNVHKNLIYPIGQLNNLKFNYLFLLFVQIFLKNI